MASKGKFNHSIPVPRVYKIASKVAKNAKSGQSLKNLVYQEKHVNIKTLYALVVETFKRDVVIEELLEKSQLLLKEPRFDPWLAKILICEMLWGKNKMRGDSKPLQTILGYEELLKKLLSDCSDIKRDVLKHNILKPRYARVNTLKITVEEAIYNFRDEGWILVKYFNHSDYEGFLERLSNLESNEFMVDIHIPELLIFPPKTEFHNHEAYKSKSIILQDKASCLPVFLLNPSPGTTVIDMCAAPGMKTTQLAAMLKNSGIVHAVELDKTRAMILGDVVEATGATCVKTILKDVMQINDSDCPDVEYILVDPSCTGSGITDRVEVDDPDFHDRMGRLKKLCNFQAKLLRHATTAFPKAKRIVYSTCSVNAEENEDVVRQILETCRNFKLIDAKKLLKSWNDTSSEVFPVLGKMCVYATPEKDKTNGFFIAVLERLVEGEINPYLNVELCKLYDRGKKSRRSNYRETKEENMSQNNFNDKKTEEINVKHETNPSSTADEVPLLKKNRKKFKQENEVTMGEHFHMRTENVINITGTYTHSDGIKMENNEDYYSSHRLMEQNIDELQNIKNKKNKLQENISEQVDETVISKELDEGIINEKGKVKKKKRKKLTCEETTEILEVECPEENDNKKRRKKEPYDEVISNDSSVDISKINEDKKLHRNKNKIEEKKQTLKLNDSLVDDPNDNVNSQKYRLRNKHHSERENEGLVDILNDSSNFKKKKKCKNEVELFNEIENEMSLGISNENTSSSEQKTAIRPLSTEVISSTKKLRKQERALHNENEISINISDSNQKIMNLEYKKKKVKQDEGNVEHIRDIETMAKTQTKFDKSQNRDENQVENTKLIHNSKRDKKQLDQYDDSVNAIDNKDSLMDYSATENKKLKKKRKTYSEEFLISKENPNRTMEDYEDLKVKKNKKEQKQIDVICTENDSEKKETLKNNSSEDVNSKEEQKRHSDEAFIENENRKLILEECEVVKLKKNKKKKQIDIIHIEPDNQLENEESLINKSINRDINSKKEKKKHYDESLDESKKIELTMEDYENVKLKKKIRKQIDIYNNDKVNSDNLLEISYMNEVQKAKKNGKSDIAICNETENSNGNNKTKKKKQMSTEYIELLDSTSAISSNLVEKVFLDINGKLKKM